MKVDSQQFNQLFPKAISAFLVFWLSGVLVLACCGSHLFAVSAVSPAIKEEMSCPRGEAHKCCKKSNQKDTSERVSQAENDKADCCVFKPQKTLSANLQNSKNTKQSPNLNPAETINPEFFVKQTYKPAKIYRSAIRIRGSTYLKNCVFRI